MNTIPPTNWLKPAGVEEQDIYCRGRVRRARVIGRISGRGGSVLVLGVTMPHGRPKHRIVVRTTAPRAGTGYPAVRSLPPLELLRIELEQTANGDAWEVIRQEALEVAIDQLTKDAAWDRRCIAQAANIKPGGVTYQIELLEPHAARCEKRAARLVAGLKVLKQRESIRFAQRTARGT